jgi:hypothetical protein
MTTSENVRDEFKPAERAQTVLVGMANILFRYESQIPTDLKRELGGFALQTADVFVVGEDPRIAETIAPMRARIAQMTGCEDIPADSLIQTPPKQR